MNILWCDVILNGGAGEGAEGVINDSAGGCVPTLFPCRAHSGTPRSILTLPGWRQGPLRLRQDALTSHGGHSLQPLSADFTRAVQCEKPQRQSCRFNLIN